MSKRLTDEDRRAVDMLLDRMSAGGRSSGNGGNGNSGDGRGNGGGSYSSQVVTEPRIRATERVLSLLAALPAGEPPADLLGRTMKRIDQNVAGLPATGSARDLTPSAYRPQQPHA